MKRIFFVATLAFMFGANSFAQVDSSKDVISREEYNLQRSVEEEKAQKALEREATKEAKAEAKLRKKNHWEPAIGTASMEQQLKEVRLRRAAANKYILGESSATSTSAAVAHKEAVRRARYEIAAMMKSQMTTLNELTDENLRLSDGELQTISKMIDTNQSLSQSVLGRTEVIVDLVRVVDGKYEEYVVVSYDDKLAKDALMKMFEEDESEIKHKLQGMLKVASFKSTNKQ